MASQPECFPRNLLVDVTLKLESNPAHREPCRPVVELPFSFTHTLFVALGVNTNVGADTRVYPVFHSPQSHPNGLVCDLERLGSYSAVVVFHAQSIIAPNDGCAPSRTTGGYMGAAFLGFRLLRKLWREPVTGWGRSREASRE
jgi:hypothetical protein